MKKIITLLTLVFLISLVSAIAIIQPEIRTELGRILYIYSLENGKNYIEINFTVANQIYASELIRINPDIETISYTEDNKSIGYANIFKGVGKNFILQPGTIYEITAKKEINISLT